MIGLLHGDVISGGAVLAMVVIYYALMRRIDRTNASVDLLRSDVLQKIEDIKTHLDQVTKTVIRTD